MHSLQTMLGTAALGVTLLGAAQALAAPAAWQVDSAHSQLGFSGAMGGTPFDGAFQRWTAQIRFDPKDLAHSSVTADVDMTSARSGDADRDQAMPTDTWFAAAHFPRAVFDAHSFKDLGGGHFQAIGTLSLRGVTRPLTLPFTLAIAGDTAQMNGAVDLDRTAFGVGQGQWRTGETVSAKVRVSLKVTAHRAH